MENNEISSWTINDLESFLKKENVSSEVINTILFWEAAYFNKVWDDGYSEGWFDGSK